MGYVFEHEGKQYSPDGKVSVEDTRIHNEQIEAKEIAWLRTGPEKVFLYVKVGELRDPNRLGSRLVDGSMARANGDDVQIQTWLGTRVSTWEVLGPRVYVGFGHNTYRRSVSCKIFGVLYSGWFMESSGSYCRLKRAKRQA